MNVQSDRAVRSDFASTLVPPTCDHCSAEEAVPALRIPGTPITRQVCISCLIANDGRTG
jgi:hypothetical protein